MRTDLNKNNVSKRVFQFLVLWSIVLNAGISCTDSLSKSPFIAEKIGTDIPDTSAIGTGIEILGGTIKATDASIGILFVSDKSEDYKVQIILKSTSTSFEFKDILNKHPNNFLGGKKNVYHFHNLSPDHTYDVSILREKGSLNWVLTMQFKTKELD